MCDSRKVVPVRDDRVANFWRVAVNLGVKMAAAADMR